MLKHSDSQAIRLNTLWAKAKMHKHNPAKSPRLSGDERNELSRMWKDMGMQESELIELIDSV